MGAGVVQRKWTFLAIAVVLISAITLMLRVSAGSTLDVTPQQVISSGNDGQLAMVIPLEPESTLKPVKVNEGKDVVTVSVQIHLPFHLPWDNSHYAYSAETKRIVVKLTSPLGNRELAGTEGEPIPVDRLPTGCAIPDPEYSDSRSLALGTRNLKRSQSFIKIAFGDVLNRKISQVKAVECTDRVYVSAVPGSERSSHKVQIVTVRLAAPIGMRPVMSMNNDPLPAY